VGVIHLAVHHPERVARTFDDSTVVRLGFEEDALLLAPAGKVTRPADDAVAPAGRILDGRVGGDDVHLLAGPGGTRFELHDLAGLGTLVIEFDADPGVFGIDDAAIVEVPYREADELGGLHAGAAEVGFVGE